MNQESVHPGKQACDLQTSTTEHWSEPLKAGGLEKAKKIKKTGQNQETRKEREAQTAEETS